MIFSRLDFFGEHYFTTMHVLKGTRITLAKQHVEKLSLGLKQLGIEAQARQDLYLSWMDSLKKLENSFSHRVKIGWTYVNESMQLVPHMGDKPSALFISRIYESAKHLETLTYKTLTSAYHFSFPLKSYLPTEYFRYMRLSPAAQELVLVSSKGELLETWTANIWAYERKNNIWVKGIGPCYCGTMSEQLEQWLRHKGQEVQCKPIVLSQPDTLYFACNALKYLFHLSNEETSLINELKIINEWRSTLIEDIALEAFSIEEFSQYLKTCLGTF
jgi:branched-subunit amino acid aminotransferase/4-amino-4-deoxychorismate lyase